MKHIKLKTKEELNIYMNPIRQQLLRELAINAIPMTPKMLADKLSISASSVSHHIKKLLTIGVIELDHQEIIRGIKASYYKNAEVTVQIGLDTEDDFMEEREVYLQNSLANVYEGFRTQISKVKQKINTKEIDKNIWGDILTGVLYLDAKESSELLEIVQTYIEKHAKPQKDKNPWEYALVLYNTKDITD
ncbi:winged helix-turn-helix domain-containing protein [Candidatus Galacturonibacter soehngenii]|uniref:Helix-turn-helix transcriptional regulator n=1 Tax=Candidatus Galacturonatibacter soehngenii TaxID=2307010 RepID=A0A7V7UCE6_9FIRM|nr:helix-turn-helix domain-containing protein [Candidatus Galacturonibacter soehngenii]KAB1439610.1 helix-turn-helix transcriptional regulator [Candidatus Galacturonibacter soehngenii]